MGLKSEQSFWMMTAILALKFPMYEAVMILNFITALDCPMENRAISSVMSRCVFPLLTALRLTFKSEEIISSLTYFDSLLKFSLSTRGLDC